MPSLFVGSCSLVHVASPCAARLLGPHVSYMLRTRRHASLDSVAFVSGLAFDELLQGDDPGDDKKTASTRPASDQDTRPDADTGDDKTGN